MKYSYLSCVYFSRQKIRLSSAKVKIACLQKNSLYLMFITTPYPMQKITPEVLHSLTHFTLVLIKQAPFQCMHWEAHTLTHRVITSKKNRFDNFSP